MNPAQWILVMTVRCYQWTLSPLKSALLGPAARCRFTPSCSQYALEAIRCQGALRGGWLSLKRVCRCHPWGGCGHDPVPPRRLKQPRLPDRLTHPVSLPHRDSPPAPCPR